MGERVDARRLSARAALGTLKKVREHAVDEAAGALGRAAEVARSAAEARRAAEEIARFHAEGISACVVEGRNALERGILRAGDLVAEGLWLRRAEQEQGVLAARLGQAREVEARQAVEEQRARDELLARKVDADVVGAVVARRDAEAQKAAEARAEQAASETWRAPR